VDIDGAPLEAKKIILATGSRLKIPDVPGLDQACLTTDQVLDMTAAPSSVLVFGSGPIEMEMAALLNSFGSKVVIASESRRLLPREDGDTSQRLARAMREQGVEVIPRMTLNSVRRTNGGYVCLLSGAKEQTVEMERVLVASRKPNTDRMGLDSVGVRMNEDGSIRVDEKLETSVKGIYAVGDAAGGWMFSHSASSMGVTAAENAMGQTEKFPFHLVPRAVWTFPEIGAVGLGEAEAEKKGLDIEVGDFPYTINGLAMSRDRMVGAVKVISDARYGEILGVHIVGANATELIGEAVLAMQLECTAKEFARSIRAHPTFSETLVDAARDAAGWALYLPKR
jgi:dihydrolipoamide dehydrogenase